VPSRLLTNVVEHFDEMCRRSLQLSHEITGEAATIRGAAGAPRARRARALTGAVMALVAMALALPATAPAQLSFTAPTDYAVGDFPRSAAVGDFDGDSDPDLAVANESSNNVSVRLGEAGAGFAAATEFPVGSDPAFVVVGNLNGDSDPDLAVANVSSHNVSVLLGNGDGSFGLATNFPVGANSLPGAVAVGDFDGDTDSDLAVANGGTGDVSVLLGDGQGGFSGPTSVGVGDFPNALAVGDLDDDSDLDLAVANVVSDNVSVLLGDGNGGFTPAPTPTVAVGRLPSSMAVGEFNSDSDPDLAVANSGSQSGDISVLLGEEEATFAAATNFPAAAGHGPVSVAVGDFDGDFDSDLAVANRVGTVSVLPGDGEGGFAAASTFFVGDQPLSVAVGDFDGDFDADLTLTKPLSDNVAVLLNNNAPAAAGDAYGTDEDTALHVTAPGVLGNDTDRDGDGLEAVLASDPAHGSVTLGSDGSFSYRPDPDFNGSDSFTYRAGDGYLESDTATVTIEVRPVEEPPADPASTPPTGAASTPPTGAAPSPPAEPALAGVRLDSRCVKRSRSGHVRVRMTLRMARPAPVQVRIDRALAAKATKGCPKPNPGRRFRKIATLRQLPTRPAAAGRRVTLRLRLTPGLYRLTVRAHLDGNRLSRPARRYLRVRGG
jgi:hypothetical protein